MCMKKLALALALSLLLCLACVPALAVMVIDDVVIVGAYQSDDGSVIYDPATRTLTLNNHHSVGYGTPVAADHGEIREIVLIGDNTIRAASSSYGMMFLMPT